MDLQSPRSLQDLCINVLAEKPHILWRWKDRSVFSEPVKVEWRDPELFLHHQFADRLLEILSCNGMLGNNILSTFTQEHTCLKNVKICYNNHITKDGLQVLSHHKLISLDIKCLLDEVDVNICTVLKCIGNKSYESLQHLVLQSQQNFWPHDFDLAGQSVVETLSRFNCLKRVDIIGTGLTNTMLTILGKSLLHVENLDLSWNYAVTDISPLQNCQKTLKSLSLGTLPDMRAESAMATFVTLTGLTYLDVTFVRRPHRVRDGKKEFTADKLLQMPDVLPNLECLDLSGRTVTSEHALSQFLDAHQSLRTLMLWDSLACEFQSLQDYRPRLTVGGHATLEQYAAVLRRWTRTKELREWSVFCAQQRCFLSSLSEDLKRKQYPPCHDDQLVQAVLGISFGVPSRLWDRAVRCQTYNCLEVISILLEKRITIHLEPDTKQRVLQLCHGAARQSHWPEAQKLAINILQAFETGNHKTTMSERPDSA